jgi:hypothetical protein
MAFRLMMAGKLQMLMSAIARSPIVVHLRARVFSPADWARIRKSPEVDAFVLAWIASHVSERRPPRTLI